MLVLGFAAGGMLRGGSGIGGGWVAVAGLLAVVGVVLLALLVFTRGAVPPILPPPEAPPGPQTGSTSTAPQSLDARYARGEITRDEYLALREELESRKG